MPHVAPVPDFVIAGNVVRDIVPGGWEPGGTAVYAAAVAYGLGRRVGVVTAAPADVVAAGLPADVAVARANAAEARDDFGKASKPALDSIPRNGGGARRDFGPYAREGAGHRLAVAPWP